MTDEERAATPTNWIVELGCGHRIRVAREDGSLGIMAHLVQHRTLCPERSARWTPELGLALPLPLLPGGPSR